MEGRPEGTGAQPRRVPSYWLLPAVVLVGYLLFRLGQGLLWLVHNI